MQEMWVQSLSREDPLEKEMANYSSILAWEIRGQRSLAGLRSMGLQRVGHDLATKQQQRGTPKIAFQKVLISKVTVLVLLFYSLGELIYSIKQVFP